MDDSKRGLNLVGTTVANIKNDLLGLANIIENQVLPKINKMATGLQQARLLGPTGQPISSANKLADSGAPGAPKDTSGGGNGNNVIASRAAGAAAVGNAIMAFGNFASNAMPSAATAVRQDLLTSQAAFYGQGGFGGGLGGQTAAVRAMQNALARRGIATNAMDTTNALAMAQSLGLSGATNFNQVMQGAAVASAFAPGIGVTGAVQAMGTMNAPATVNMLRTVGINVRTANGSVKPLPAVADEIWNFITQNGRSPLSEKDIQVGLMPGNGLYGMLTSLFGQDQLTYTLVANMLLARAKTGGRTRLQDMSRAQLQDMGLVTPTVNKMAAQTAAQTNLLTGTASSIAAGYGASADLGTAMNNFAAAAGPLTQALGAFTGAYTGTMGLGNGSVGSSIKTGLGLAGGWSAGKAAMSKLPQLLKFLMMAVPKEKGGHTGSGSPYIVGEKGPELFIPKTDGVIIPNGIFRDGGGGSRSGGALSDTELKNILMGAGFSGDSLTNAMAVARAESGGRSGALNPNASTGDYSMGLFQINMIGEMGKRRNAQYLQQYGSMGYKGPESLYDPAINAAIAYQISKGGTDFTKAWVNTSKKLGLVGGGVASDIYTGMPSTSSQDVTFSTADYYSKIKSLIASSNEFSQSAGAGVNNTYNHGPLTITINGATDVNKTMDALQNLLASNNLISSAGGS